MEIKDIEVSKAIDTIRQYCEEHEECENCKMDCTMLKRGIAPCFWIPLHLEQVLESNI